MQNQDGTGEIEASTSVEESQQGTGMVEPFLAPSLERLDASLDRSVVGNLAAAGASLIQTEREVSLTEVGAGICGPDPAQAGVPRLDHALHHEGWPARLIGQVLGEQADQRLAQRQARHERVVRIHDRSVVEKAESEQTVGQSAVRSSRARRLGRTRTHLFTQVQLPLRVPGLEGEPPLVVGTRGIPVLGERWWGQRHQGEAGQHVRLPEAMVIRTSKRWGKQAEHVFDRG